MAYEGMLSLDRQIRGEKSEQKYIDTEVPLAYFQLSRMARDMRSGKTDGGFSASIHGVESTISYRSITSMPGWYVIVELANKDISDITLIYMLSIMLLEKKSTMTPTVTITEICA